MKTIKISDGERERMGGSIATKEFFYDGVRYELRGATILSVPDACANAWNAADSTVEIMYDLDQSV